MLLGRAIVLHEVIAGNVSLLCNLKLTFDN